MFPRLLSKLAAFLTFHKNLIPGITRLVPVFIFICFFTGPARGQQDPEIDSAYASGFDSLLSVWNLEKPDMAAAPIEKIIREYLGRDNLEDTVRLSLYFLINSYLYELNRFQASLDLLADALADSSIISNPCLAGYISMYMSETYACLQDYQGVEISLLQASSQMVGCPFEDRAWASKSLAYLYVTLGRYQESSALFKQAIDMLEKADSSETNEMIDCLSGLGYVHQIQIRFHDAELTYLEAISLSEQNYGYYSLQLLRPLLYLGGLYRYLGRYHKCQEILQRAQVVCDSLQDPYHPYRGMLYGHMGQYYMDLGKYDDAQTYLQASLEIKESSPFKDVEGIAAIYILLGKGELEKQNYDEAVAFFNKGYEICGTIAGGYQLYQSPVLTFLASAYLEMGNYDQAVQIIDSSLAICALIRGADSPHYGVALIRKGEILNASGQYDKARKCFLEGIAVYEKHYDPYHQRLVYALECMARTCCSMGEVEAGLKYYRDFLSRRLKFIEYAFSFSSEEQKLRWVNSNPVIDNSLLSLAIEHHDQTLIRDACEMILRGKGIVIDALATQHKTTYCTYDSTLITLAGQHRITSEKIAALASAGTYYESDIYRKDTIEVLYRVKDSLENELSRRCSQFSDLLTSFRFDIDAVLAELSDDEVLLEYVKYTPYDFTRIGHDSARGGPARYAVFILPARGSIRLIDLGPAQITDSLINAALETLHATGVEIYTPAGDYLEDQLRQITGKIHKRLFEPTHVFLNDRKTIFIAPDGALNLLPFEILADSDSTYLIEHFQFQYLSSGRDLLPKTQDHQASNHYNLIVADPDYDYSLAESEHSRPTRNDTMATRNNHGQCFARKFMSIPGTRREAKDIAAHLIQSSKMETREYYGDKATEETLKNLAEPPFILHLATHGFFCSQPDTDFHSDIANPMIRAGLALAGANRVRDRSSANSETEDDGILYALEIAALNLNNTELAVLSACQTGYGDILDGEGVIGLRRALKQSGVKTIVMSLWTVPDRETSNLISGFYRRWLEGKSKAAALRSSALEILRNQRTTRGNGHPYFWGGFILCGSPD